MSSTSLKTKKPPSRSVRTTRLRRCPRRRDVRKGPGKSGSSLGARLETVSTLLNATPGDHDTGQTKAWLARAGLARPDTGDKPLRGYRIVPRIYPLVSLTR